MLKQTNTDNWFFNFLCNSPPTSVYIELMFDTNHGCPITYWSIFENTHWHWYTNNLLGNQYLNRRLKLGYKTFTKTEEVWQRLEETIKALAGISQCLSMLMHVQKNDQQFINMPIQWFHQCLQKQDYWHTINLSATGYWVQYWPTVNFSRPPQRIMLNFLVGGGGRHCTSLKVRMQSRVKSSCRYVFDMHCRRENINK